MVALVAPSPASAAFKLRITHIPGGSTTISDTNAAPDLNPTTGAITALDGVSVSTGLSKPIHPTTMDLNSVYSSAVAETIILELTDTDFPAVAVPHQIIGNVGGTTTGTVSFKACVDPSNTEFGVGGTCVNHGPFVSGGPTLAFSDNSAAAHGPLPVYSLTLIATIVHGAGDLTSFNYQVDSVPEPSQVVLFGAGVLGLAYLAMRRRQAMNF